MNIQLVNRFKLLYGNFKEANLIHLEDIYDKKVVFRDPVHSLTGLVLMQDYMTKMCADLKECRFEYLDELVQENSAYIKWIMHFRHAGLGSKLISVRGVTHIQYTDTIHFHEDIYDMGAMIYEHVPLMSSIIQWLKRRLTN